MTTYTESTERGTMSRTDSSVDGPPAWQGSGYWRASGDLFAQYRILGSPTPDTNADPQQVAEGIRNSSLGALVAMLLPAIAATLGGWLGAREPVVSDVS